MKRMANLQLEMDLGIEWNEYFDRKSITLIVSVWSNLKFCVMVCVVCSLSFLVVGFVDLRLLFFSDLQLQVLLWIWLVTMLEWRCCKQRLIYFRWRSYLCNLVCWCRTKGAPLQLPQVPKMEDIDMYQN
jgi:hypothetical protein